MDLAPRYCTVTGTPMYEGYLVSDMYYAANVQALLELIRRVYGIVAIAPEGEELLLEMAYDAQLYCYTDWRDLSEDEWLDPPTEQPQ